jgi:hypothetical protein
MPSSAAADIKNGTPRCRLCQPSGASSASLG